MYLNYIGSNNYTQPYTTRFVVVIHFLCVFIYGYLYGSHPFSFITRQTTLIQCDTKQAYFNSKWAFTRILHVSAYTEAILVPVNKKLYKGLQAF